MIHDSWHSIIEYTKAKKVKVKWILKMSSLLCKFVWGLYKDDVFIKITLFEKGAKPFDR